MSDFWHNGVNIDLKWPVNETIIIIIYLFTYSLYMQYLDLRTSHVETDLFCNIRRLLKEP